MPLQNHLEAVAHQFGVTDGYWFDALLDTLDQVDAEQARFKPWPAAHSIWENVLHTMFWIDETLRRLESPRSNAETDFPAPPRDATGRDWDLCRKAARESIVRLIDACRALDDRRADEPAVGIEMLRGELMIGLLGHTAYHVGQIRLLRGLQLNGAPPARSSQS